MNYILPQVQVFQEFQQLPQSVVANLNAFVFGPNYKLFRYSNASEKALIGLGVYNRAVDTAYTYPYVPAGSTVDTNYVKLYMDNVVAQYIALDTSNNLVAKSNVELNKLRAMPTVGAVDTPLNSAVALTTGVTMTAGGCFTGGDALPATYYMVPTTSIAYLNSDLHAVTAATLKYVTSGGVKGTFTIPTTPAPLASGTTVQGPHGMVLNLDAGVRSVIAFTYTGNPTAADTLTLTHGSVYEFDGAGANVNVAVGATGRATMDTLKAAIAGQGSSTSKILEVIHMPGDTTSVGTVYLVIDTAATTPISGVTKSCSVVTLTSASTITANTLMAPNSYTITGTTGTFGVVVGTDALVSMLDESIDAGRALKVTWTTGAGSTAVTYTAGTNTIAISVKSDATLTQLRNAIVGNTDAAAILDCTEIFGDATEQVATITDQFGSGVVSGTADVVIRDAYRVAVTPNALTFAAGNGHAISAQFYTRGVKVGDQLKYTVSAGGTTYSGMTLVTGFEAETEAAKVTATTASASNMASQTAVSVYPNQSVFAIASAAGNQRNFAGTVQPAYDGVHVYTGDYTAGVLSEGFVITVTTEGLANVAKVTVTSTSGAYTAYDVPVVESPTATTAVPEASIQLGYGLEARIVKNSAADFVFKLGDVFATAEALTAGFTAVPVNTVIADGIYTGPSDTTYMAQVTRGGVFNRNAVAFGGVQNNAITTIAYKNATAPSNNDTVLVCGTTYTFKSSANPANGLEVAISGSADAAATNLTAAINAYTQRINAVVDTVGNTIKLYGDPETLAGTVSTSSGWKDSITQVASYITPTVDWDAWELSAGDVNDEYTITCTKAGDNTTALFAVKSLRGDNATALKLGALTLSGSVYVSGALAVAKSGLSIVLTNLTATASFALGDSFVVRVLGCRPVVRITDSAGVDTSTTAVVNDGEVIASGNYGVTVTFRANPNTQADLANGGGLVAGDVFYIACTSVASGAFKTLVLADDLPASLTAGATVNGAVTTFNYAPSTAAVNLYLVQASAVIDPKNHRVGSGYNWTANGSAITVKAGIYVQDASWVDLSGAQPWMPVYSGNSYVQYRALLGDYADGIYSMTDPSQVVLELGTVDVDNPLAQGVYNALLNAGAQAVYFMATPTDDAAGYSVVLDRATQTNTVYGLNPVTTDVAIHELVAGHVTAQSNETKKRWRTAFIGSSLPVEVAKLDKTSNGNTDYLGNIDDPNGSGLYRRLTINNGAPQLLARAKAGDTVRIAYTTDAWGDVTYSTYTVAQVLSNTTLALVQGPGAPIATLGGVKVEIWHTNSTTEIADAVAAISAGFGSRRVYNVFPAVAYTAGVAQTAPFIASAVAGLTSSVVPQQGLTNIEVTGFDDLPMVSRTFTADQLNTIAAGGTLIVMQDAVGGSIYVRHQISTATSQGNLLTTELSITKNLDAISYYFAGVLAPYIGRYNVTPQLVELIRNRISDGIGYLTGFTSVGMLGPMVLLSDNTKITLVQQHPTLKDHIVATIQLDLPVPANVIQLHIVV